MEILLCSRQGPTYTECSESTDALVTQGARASTGTVLTYLTQTSPLLKQKGWNFLTHCSLGDMSDFKCVIFKCVVVITFMSISIVVTFRRIMQSPTDDKSIFVQVMAIEQQAITWTNVACGSMMLYGITSALTTLQRKRNVISKIIIFKYIFMLNIRGHATENALGCFP